MSLEGLLGNLECLTKTGCDVTGIGGDVMKMGNIARGRCSTLHESSALGRNLESPEVTSREPEVTSSYMLKIAMMSFICCAKYSHDTGMSD